MALLTSTVSVLGHVLYGTRSNRLIILIYHRVHSRLDPMFPGEVDAVRFDWQIRLLRQYCHPLPLADAVAQLKGGKLPSRAIAVTFDDGYANNAAVALPILQRYGIAATFFVAPGFLDGGRMWNDSIIESVRGASAGAVDLSDFGLGAVQFGPETGRGVIAESIIKAVKHLPPSDRAERVSRLVERLGVALPTDLMMTSSDVRRLADAGMEIGAHTMSHPILRTLDAIQAQAEMQNSRTALESIIDRPVRAFAYPNGRPGDDYTMRDRDLVRTLGFDYAPCTTWGAATSASDVFQLPRFTPWDSTPARWIARLLLAFRNPA